MCLELQERFDWNQRSTGWHVDQRWTSRTANFFLCHGSETGPPVVVLKVLARERNPQPQADYRTLMQLEEIHRQTQAVTARPPRALGWLGEPPVLAMEYLPGESGSKLVARCLSARDIEELERLVRFCGATLGAWHTRSEVTRVDDIRHDSYRRLSRTARRLGIRPSTVLRGDSELSLVRRFRDFSVYNIQKSEDDEIVVLDPPAASGGYDLACRDIAWFMASIATAATGATVKSEARRRVVSEYPGNRERLVKSFAVGYAMTTNAEPCGAELRAAALLEAAFLLARSARRARSNRSRASSLVHLSWNARMVATKKAPAWTDLGDKP